MKEVVKAFNFVIDQGWAFYWGTSEWTTAQLLEAHRIADQLGLEGPQMEQCEYKWVAKGLPYLHVLSLLYADLSFSLP